MPKHCFKGNTRSSHILNLTKNVNLENQSQNDENIVPDSPVRMDESQLKALEALIDDELSSDRTWLPPGSPFQECNIKNTDDSDSFIPDSNETSPIPFPAYSDFGTGQPASLKLLLLSAVSPQALNKPPAEKNDISHDSQTTLATNSDRAVVLITKQTALNTSESASNVPGVLEENNDDSRTILTAFSPAPIPSVNSLVTISDCESPSSPYNTQHKKRKSTFKSNPGKKRRKCE